MQVQFTVNGRAASVDVPPNTLLVHALREHLQLTGTHVGCDTAQCGACTVHLNGRAIKSCNVLLAQVAGGEVTTIEGLASADGWSFPSGHASASVVAYGMLAYLALQGVMSMDYLGFHSFDQDLRARVMQDIRTLASADTLPPAPDPLQD